MDLPIDNSGDLVITDGNFVLVDGIPAIEQQLRVALRMFKGEWFLAPNDGIPYIQTIFVKGTSLGVITTLLRKAILAVPGVTQINTFDLQFNAAARTLSVSFSATITDGSLLTFTSFEI